MLNISGLDNGIVLDHIPAGMSMEIYKYLNLGKLDSQVAIIKNASSKKMGKKDIIKIAGGLDSIDLDVIGFLNHKITVNIITNGKISEKKTLHLPKKNIPPWYSGTWENRCFPDRNWFPPCVPETPPQNNLQRDESRSPACRGAAVGESAARDACPRTADTSFRPTAGTYR